MNKKKILAVSASAVIVLSVIPLAVLAYLRSVPEQKENKIIIQSVQETVEETFPTVEAQRAGENSFTKEVAVKNNGTAPCYVRVYMDFSDSTIRAKSELSADGTTFKTWDNYLNKEALPETLTENGKWVYLEPNGTNGILGGYFYYTKLLEPEKSTDFLLKKVKTTYNNTEEITDFQIIVYSETVQAVDNNGNLLPCKTAWENFLKRN